MGSIEAFSAIFRSGISVINPTRRNSTSRYNELMRTTHHFSFAILFFALLLSACGVQQAPVDPAYLDEIETWRYEREGRLRASDGWLTLVGLDWLEVGDNHMGSASDAEVVLPAPGVPDEVGLLRVEDGVVTLVPADGVEILIDDTHITTARVLRSDAEEGGPDHFSIGRLTAHVIARGDRLAVRVKDPEASTRVDFPGLDFFSIDPAFRVEARLEPYDEPIEVAIPTAVGTDDTMFCPGVLHFEVMGQEIKLRPWLSQPESRSLFIVFRDTTSDETTYGAGRFLYAELAENNTAVLDFNKAYTPPCGFTPYATCPLAPPENVLPVAITAGERLVH
jgi:uncharacterized protein (DUF1684 family)